MARPQRGCRTGFPLLDRDAGRRAVDKIRPRGQYQLLDTEVLTELYVNQGLSLKQVAEVARSARDQARGAACPGIPRDRVAPRPSACRLSLQMSAEESSGCYVNEGRSVPGGRLLRCRPGTVIKRMRAVGIERRKGAWRSVGTGAAAKRTVHELRVVQTHVRGCDRGRARVLQIQVSSALERHGVGGTWRRNGKAWPNGGSGEAVWLHNTQGLSRGRSPSPVHQWGSSVAARMRDRSADRPANAHCGWPKTLVPVIDGSPVRPGHDLLAESWPKYNRAPKPRSTPTTFRAGCSGGIAPAASRPGPRVGTGSLGCTASRGTPRAAGSRNGHSRSGDRRGPPAGVQWNPHQLQRRSSCIGAVEVRQRPPIWVFRPGTWQPFRHTGGSDPADPAHAL